MSGELSPAYAGSTVYHYTDAAGLIGMVRDRVLWASESRGMNDPREGDFGLDALRRHVPADKDREAFDQHRTSAESVLGDDVYVACASTRKDDVSQWMRYTPWPDVGYCVGIDAGVELGIVRTDQPRQTEYHPAPNFRLVIGEAASTSRWTPVLYGQDSTDQILREFPAWAEAQVEDAMTRLNPGDHDELDYHVERRMAEDLATTALVEVARLAKDPGFSGEGETRVVAWSLSDGEFVRYRATRYGVVRYVELGAGSRTSGFVVRAENEPPETPLPITSVRIGPSPYAERGKASVQGLLKKYGCDHVELKLSKSQVR